MKMPRIFSCVNPYQVNKTNLGVVHMQTVKSVREAVKLLGGGPAVGEATGTSRFAVHYWVKREMIPGSHYQTMRRLAAEKNLHIPDDFFARVLIHPRDIREQHDSAISDPS
jgi:hypothetical protein